MAYSAGSDFSKHRNLHIIFLFISRLMDTSEFVILMRAESPSSEILHSWK